MLCALDLFSRKGYNGTGIQEIAELSGVKKPTLYYYYGSKEGILKAILEFYFSIFIGKIGIAAAYSGDTVGTITSLAKAFLSLSLDEPIFYRMFLSMGAEASDSTAFQMILPFSNQISALVETFFRKAALDNGNMKGHEMEITLSFLGIINAYALQLLNGELQLSDALIYRVIHLFLHGIFS